MGFVTTDYQIVSGLNNAGSLVAVTSIEVGGVALVEPLGLPFVNKGLRVTRANGTVARVGKQRTEWRSSMLYTQWQHLKDNYEGLVTVRLALDGATWTNYNAVLTLNDPFEMEYVVFSASDSDPDFDGGGFSNAVWTFSQLTAI